VEVVGEVVRVGAERAGEVEGFAVEGLKGEGRERGC
jgi:hypothetical protein